MIEITTLSCGMRFVYDHIPGCRSISAGVWIGSGSRFESTRYWGISHFIEHMLFKGTQRRTARQIAEEMDGVGGQINAFTARDCTCFYTKTLDEHLDLALDLLSDMLLHSKFEEKDILTEKSVVKEELDMYEDTPEELVHDLLADVCYHGHPIGKNILGSPQTIDSFDLQKIRQYMDMRYCADDMVLAASGSLDPAVMVEKAEAYFGGVSQKPSRSEITAVPVFTTGNDYRTKAVEQAHIAVAYPGIPYGHPDLYALMLVSNILGGGMSSRLFQSLREEKGLAYSVYAYPNIYQDTGYITVYAGCAKEKQRQAAEMIYDEIENLQKNGITRQELERTKQQMKGSFLLSNETTGSRMSGAGKQLLLYGRVKSDQEILNLTEAVDMESAARAAALFERAKASECIVSPEA